MNRETGATEMMAADHGLLGRISRNTGVLTVAYAGEKVFNFFLVVLLVRYLSEEVFGQYGFISSYVLLFNVLVGLGFAALCTREIARRPEDTRRILTAALVPMVFSSLLTFLIISLSIMLTKPGQPDVIVAVHLAAADLILNSFTTIFDTVPRARERMVFCVIPRIVRSILLFALCLALLPRGIGLVGVYSLVALTSAVALGMQVAFCKTIFHVMPSPMFDRKLCVRMLASAYPLALTSVFVIIYYRIDSVMLSYMRSDREVGLYVAASTLAYAALFIASAFHQATYPVLAKLHVTSRRRLRSFYRLSIKYLAMAGLPMACGLAVLAPQIVFLVYGERYDDSSGTLQVLAIALLLMFMNGFMGNTLIAVDDQKALMRVVGMGVLLNVGLNLAIIPRYGILGAASTTVATEAFANILFWVVLSRRHGIVASFPDLLRSAICCSVMGVCAIWWFSLPLLIIIVLSAFVYFGLLCVTRGIGMDELRLIRRMLSTGDVK